MLLTTKKFKLTKQMHEQTKNLMNNGTNKVMN